MLALSISVYLLLIYTVVSGDSRRVGAGGRTAAPRGARRLYLLSSLQYHSDLSLSLLVAGRLSTGNRPIPHPQSPPLSSSGPITTTLQFPTASSCHLKPPSPTHYHSTSASSPFCSKETGTNITDASISDV